MLYYSRSRTLSRSKLSRIYPSPSTRHPQHARRCLRTNPAGHFTTIPLKLAELDSTAFGDAVLGPCSTDDPLPSPHLETFRIWPGPRSCTDHPKIPPTRCNVKLKANVRAPSYLDAPRVSLRQKERSSKELCYPHPMSNTGAMFDTLCSGRKTWRSSGV